MTTKYPQCDHIKRPTPGIEITNEIAEAIGREYRTLPIFEKGLHEITYKKYYSIESNEFLKCRWSEYKKNIENRISEPVFFLNIRNYHFYNCRNRLIPSESIFLKNDFRMKLKPGPGVDIRGQIPIPNELFMKRGTQKPKGRKARPVIVTDEEKKKEDSQSLENQT